MKKAVFSFLVVLMLGLSGCFKKGDNINNYDYVPALIDNFDFFIPVLKMAYPFPGPVTSQDFIDKIGVDFHYGDAVIAFYEINFDIQPTTEYYTATKLQCVVITKSWTQPTPDGESMTDDFDHPIESMGLYGWVDNYWFWGFNQKDADEKDLFQYEMTYDSEQTGTPVIKIRAMKSDNGSIPVRALDMSSFFWTYMDADKKVKFNVQFKTGVDDNGKDVYDYCKDYNGGVITFNAEVK